MLKKLFSKYLPARNASNPHTHAGAFVITLLALFVAAFHRFEGFAEPYQVWFRNDEIYYLGSWAPSFIEHLAGAFALCSLFTLFWGIFGKPTARNRALLAGTFAIVYFVLSTVMHDGMQFVATHDTDQLLQMLADVLGLAAALVWLAWPAAPNDESAFA
jgi:drug/metabolite transporter (DMT)-like permease